MKTIKINRDTIRITEPEIRGLRAVKAAGFVALDSDLYERRQGGYGTDLRPWGARQWEVLGMHRQCGNEGWMIGDQSLRLVTKSEAELERVKAFFARHPRAKIAVVGDPRRINAILRKVDATR